MLYHIRILVLAGLFAVYAPLLVTANQPVDNSTNDPFKPFPDQLDPSLFNQIQDRVFGGVLPEEKDLYYEVLNHLNKTSEKEQKQAADFNLQQRRSELKTFRDHPNLKLPLFPDIFKNLNRYKGRLVTLTGRVRKLIHYPAEENKYGIKTLYEAWLFTDDSQQNPAVIICTEVPKALQNGLPEGKEVIDHVTVTGYVFKMYAYNAQDNRRIAPMILARSLEWAPQTVDEKGGHLFSLILAGTLIVLILGAAIVMWKAMQKDKQFRENRLQTDQGQVSFENLESKPEPTKPESKPDSQSQN